MCAAPVCVFPSAILGYRTDAAIRGDGAMTLQDLVLLTLSDRCFRPADFPIEMRAEYAPKLARLQHDLMTSLMQRTLWRQRLQCTDAAGFLDQTTVFLHQIFTELDHVNVDTLDDEPLRKRASVLELRARTTLSVARARALLSQIQESR